MEKLTKDPFLLLAYLIIAMVVIANIFVSGYWFGRTRQVLEDIRPNEVSADTTSLR